LILMALLVFWAKRNRIGPDGVSYLDIANSYAHGRWHDGVNAFWGPLYSWLIAAQLRVLRPSPHGEVVAVQTTNLLAFLLALAAFHAFLNRLARKTAGIPSPIALRITGLFLFAWSTFAAITIGQTTPDKLVAAAVYLAAAVLLDISRSSANSRNFVLLGVILALGYYAKAPMFLFGLAILATAGVSQRDWKRSIPCALLGVGVFLALCAPWLCALSLREQRLTFGESGRLNYAWRVNGVQDTHWQGAKLQGYPLHATRQIYESPPVFEFGSPIGGTYPPWYDPAYWNAGLKPRFNLQQQVAALKTNLASLASIFWGAPTVVVVAVLLSAFLGGWREALHFALPYWPLSVIGAFAIATYLAVHLEARYVGAFLVLMLLPPVIGVLHRAGKGAPALAAVICLACMLQVALGFARDLRDRVSPEYQRVAEALQQSGVQGDERIGVLWSASSNARWARLTGGRIVAEVDAEDGATFWAASAEKREDILSAFRRAGAAIVVSDRGPIDGSGNVTWRRVGRTSYWMSRLMPAQTAEVSARKASADLARMERTSQVVVSGV
jgi:hypothetical protein